MRESPLPPEWQCLTGLVQFVKRVSSNEYSCSCPTCGGNDRCRLFVDNHPTLWCRQCGLTAYPDQFGDNSFTPPTPQELEKFRQQREAEAVEKLRSSQRELDLLRNEKLWEQYHDKLQENERQWWRNQGIPDCYQSLWGLGWSYERNAASIPLFGYGWTFQNLKYRLLDTSKGKYRYHISGLPAPMFLCDPDKKVEGHIIAVEGEKKAAVLYVTLDDPTAVVVGIPGINPPPSIKNTLSQADRVTLILDPGSDTPGPDGWSPLGRLVRDIGRGKCRTLILPEKVDDILIAMGANKWDAEQMLRQAVANG